MPDAATAQAPAAAALAPHASSHSHGSVRRYLVKNAQMSIESQDKHLEKRVPGSRHDGGKLLTPMVDGTMTISKVPSPKMHDLVRHLHLPREQLKLILS